MRAQASSLPFTPIFAALIAIINTKLPRLGALLLSRLILGFRRAYRRNDKVTCIATTAFIGQLFNQRVASELLVLQIMSMLLDRATDDSVEIAVGFMREVGAALADSSPRINDGVFEMFRNILHGDQINKRSQYMVEVLFAVRREKFKDNPVIPEGLDLVEAEDVITHDLVLDDDNLKAEETLSASLQNWLFCCSNGIAQTFTNSTQSLKSTKKSMKTLKRKCWATLTKSLAVNLAAKRMMSQSSQQTVLARQSTFTTLLAPIWSTLDAVSILPSCLRPTLKKLYTSCSRCLYRKVKRCV